jgi:hypothetical protein
MSISTQGERPIERSQRGLGLGLNLVKRLVEMHGDSAHGAVAGAGGSIIRQGLHGLIRHEIIQSNRRAPARAPDVGGPTPLLRRPHGGSVSWLPSPPPTATCFSA